MSQPPANQGFPQDQPQHGQPQGGQQPFNAQNAGQGQQGFAPSAYSAPQPGYGQQPYYGAPQSNSAAGAFFSTDFNRTFTGPLAKLVMLAGLVTYGIFIVFALFSMITVFTSYDPGAMTIVTAIIQFVYRGAIATVLLGLLRILLEHFTQAAEKGSSNK